MKISTAVQVIRHTWLRDKDQVIYLESDPGAGKSQVATDLPKLISEFADYTPVIMRPADRDSVDFLGVPKPTWSDEFNCEIVYWSKPEELARFETGKWILIWDELADAPVMTQNVLCALFWGKKTANVTLGEDVLQIATGNPVSARSGAIKLVSKLLNRLLYLQIDTDSDDWLRWGLNNGVSPEMRAFIMRRPDMLHKFDPAQYCNPSPRAITCLDKNLSFDEFDLVTYTEVARGYVGDEFANDYAAFRELLPQMPDIADIIARPGEAIIATDPGVIFATCTGMVNRMTADNITPMFQYMARDEFPKDFRNMVVSDIRHSDALRAAGLHEHKVITDLAIETASDDLTV